MHRLIAVSIFVFFSLIASTANAWVEQVVNETERLLKSRCVSPNSPNTVYVLNATSGVHMSANDERRSVNDLTTALRVEGWFQVIHGSALPYETYTRDNNPKGRQQMYDLLARLSDATVTIFVVPLERARNVVQAEVIFLVRSIDNGTTSLTCAGAINVDIPIGSGGVVPPPDYPPIAKRGGCNVIETASHNDLDAAETFVHLYYDDLSNIRVTCAERRWLDPPDDLGEMIVQFVSARLSFNQLDRGHSDRNGALVDVVAHVETKDGARTAWRVTISLVPSRSGWLIEKMDGHAM